MGLASSSGLGAIVGLLGGVAQKVIDIKAKRLDYQHSLSMYKLDLEKAKLQGSLAIERSEADAFTESQKSAGRSSILSYVRAAITAYVLFGSTALFIAVWNRLGGLDNFTPEELSSLLSEMVSASMFMTTTCVFWWFAARGGNMKGMFKK